MKNILCYGDSNTFGYNPDFTGYDDVRFPWDVRWTGVLQKELGGDYRVIEEGLGGRTTAWEDQTVPGRNGLKMLLPVLQSHEPLDLIILMLGTNDTKRIYNQSVMEIGRGLDALIKVCRSPYTYDWANTQTKLPQVMVVSPPHLGRTFDQSWLRGVFDSESKEKIAALSGEYKKIADQYGCIFFDAGKVAEPSDTDGVHLDRSGHLALGLAMAKKIRSMEE